MNFLSYLNTLCPCGSNENFYYLCTKETCQHRGFICAECQFLKHSPHTQYCIPIKKIQIEPLSKTTLNLITSFKNKLSEIQSALNTLFNDEINFFSKMESLYNNYPSYLTHFNLLPTFSNSPPIQNTYSITSDDISFKIKTIIIEHNSHIKKTLHKQLNEMKPIFIQEQIDQIINGQLNLYNGAIYKEKLSSHVFIMKFIPNINNLFLQGIGFNARVLFGVLKSDFILKIKSRNISNNDVNEIININPKDNIKGIKEYQDINFVMLSPIKLDNNFQYEIYLTRNNTDQMNTSMLINTSIKYYQQINFHSNIFSFNTTNTNDLIQPQALFDLIDIYTHLVYIKL